MNSRTALTIALLALPAIAGVEASPAAATGYDPVPGAMPSTSGTSGPSDPAPDRSAIVRPAGRGTSAGHADNASLPTTEAADALPLDGRDLGLLVLVGGLLVAFGVLLRRRSHGRGA